MVVPPIGPPLMTPERLVLDKKNVATPKSNVGSVVYFSTFKFGVNYKKKFPILKYLFENFKIK